MLFVLNDEKADRARSIIKKVVDITQPNTGILLEFPSRM